MEPGRLLTLANRPENRKRPESHPRANQTDRFASMQKTVLAPEEVNVISGILACALSTHPPELALMAKNAILSMSMTFLSDRNLTKRIGRIRKIRKRRRKNGTEITAISAT